MFTLKNYEHEVKLEKYEPFNAPLIPNLSWEQT